MTIVISRVECFSDDCQGASC